jgi:hypothetical protein
MRHELQEGLLDWFSGCNTNLLDTIGGIEMDEN